MREILFRGKRIDNGEWAYSRCPDGILHSGVVGYDFIPETVGQYTGLSDKNGTKIFEGDIVHYQYFPGKGYWNSDQYSIIEWNSTGFDMRGIMGTNKYACCSGWLVSIPHGDGHYFEVIGNVHDNPELLGEG